MLCRVYVKLWNARHVTKTLLFFYLVRWDPRPPIFVFYGCEVLSHHNPQPKKCKIPTLFSKLKAHDFAWSSTKLWRRMYYVVALWICNANILSIWRFLQSPISKLSLQNVYKLDDSTQCPIEKCLDSSQSSYSIYL